ncbi:hypothetical protein PRZ48_012520 [Zasmidium cellare]|uniref:Heterokaryon incompatibility domain-containing protein n=1 Tax=Zasmidium cellare TaxID=395010 RepID=A0ABR0E5N9_ZASCE|nr:hypothetical protein PRZ48_012520 [Zasmidium cellare]
MAFSVAQPLQATAHIQGCLTETPPPYERLAERHIRLLEILPDTNGEKTVCCRLTSRPLESDVRYVALSYTWGRPDPNCHILINSQKISVRKNLKRFLHEVRKWSRYKHTLFWIDAVCINQADFQERSEQVKLMADIYQKAEHVLVWLGPAYANSDPAMKALARDARYWKRQMKREKVFWKPEGAAIRSLCERPYWTRLWVFQELVQAKAVLLMCGNTSISWKAFVDFSELAQSCSPARRPESFEHVAFKASPALAMIRQVHQATGEESALFDLILASRLLACSEPRDKVYALLGVARTGQQSIRPDYSASLLQLANSVLRGHHSTRPPKTIEEVSLQCRDLSEIMGVDITQLDEAGNGNKSGNSDLTPNAQLRTLLLAPRSNVSLWWIDHYDHVMLRKTWLASHTQKDIDGVLFAAIAAGEVATIRMLLDLGSSRIRLNSGWLEGSPFVEAARLGVAEIVKLLLEHDKGDLIAQIDNRGRNAMYHAIVQGHEDVVKQLICHPSVNVNGECAPGIPAPILHLAIQYNQPTIVRIILSRPETDPNMPDGYGRTPIAYAIKQCPLPIMKLILSHLGKSDPTYDYLLFHAMSFVEADTPEVIIYDNGRDSEGRTPLLTAIYWSRVNLTGLLLAHPSLAINATDDEGNTALHMVQPVTIGTCLRPTSVLIEKDPIDVTSTGYTREGLIAASRRLRDETFDIFYFENSFLVIASSFSIDAYFRFTDHLEPLRFQYKNRYKDVQYTVESDLKPHWENLVTWLQFRHLGAGPEWARPEYLPDLEDPGLQSHVLIWISRLFRIVEEMRRDPWPSVEQVLMQHRAMLGRLQSDWLENRPSWVVSVIKESAKS